MKYYKAICIGGHCGSKKERELVFYFKGVDYLEVYYKANSMPMVKHNKVGAVQKLVEITKEEYIEGRKINAYKKWSVV